MNRKGVPSRYRKAVPVTVQKAQPALNPSQRSQVKRMINSDNEYKTFVAGVSPSAVSSVATVFDICNMAQGDTDNTRTGNHIHLKKLAVRLVTNVSDNTNIFRLIFFKWKENSFYTGAPNISAVLAINSGSAVVDVLSHYNEETPEAYNYSRNIE